ncbi:MAG: hypothetical protein HYX53_16215 [Chloroflexi bacterium]|nr:hypothetical protein [Chloroflexota bacterium]
MGYLIDVQPSAGVALVVGGGAVAARKVRGLREAGFAVNVVAPEIAPEIAAGPSVLLTRRAFEPADVLGKVLVLACTDDRAVNAAVLAAARATGVLGLAADDPGASTFHTPAVHRDGVLAVAVSTGGADPALATEIRDRIAAALGEGWAERVEAARAARQARLAREAHP